MGDVVLPEQCWTTKCTMRRIQSRDSNVRAPNDLCGWLLAQHNSQLNLTPPFTCLKKIWNSPSV